MKSKIVVILLIIYSNMYMNILVKTEMLIAYNISEDACDCGKGKLACRDGETCVDAVKICDGRKDCPDNDDELSCSKWFSWILT